MREIIDKMSAMPGQPIRVRVSPGYLTLTAEALKGEVATGCGRAIPCDHWRDGSQAKGEGEGWQFEIARGADIRAKAIDK